MLSSKHLCNVCLDPLDAHPKKKCKEYFSKRLNKMMQKACQTCSSGLNYRVCPCRRRNSGVKTIPLRNSQNLIPTDFTSPSPSQPLQSSGVCKSPSIFLNVVGKWFMWCSLVRESQIYQ